MKNDKLIIFFILLFAFLLRTINLGSIPIGFTPDESSQAYSAYSLLQTGKDEWGDAWPIASFKSFLDYKAPLQTYLMVPSIAIFGLNEFAARLPSAIFGVLAVLSTYLLASKIFSKSVGMIAALVLTISPWHLQFSRMALEANLTSFLFPMGLYFFLSALEKPKYFFHTALFWGLSLYSYHAAKIFIPLFLIALAYLYRAQLRSRYLLLPICFFLLLISPQISGTIFNKASVRGSDLMVTNLDQNQFDEIHRAISYASYRTPGFVIEKFLHNKYFFALDKFIENYISYFSPTFWFTEGGRETTYSIIPGRGLLYLWQLPFIVLAVFSLQKSKNRYLPLLLVWFLVAAIPAAITKEGYRPNRAGSYATLLEVLTAYGVWSIFVYQKIYQKFLLPTILIVSLSFFVYLEDYYSGSNTKYPDAMSSGWSEAISFIKPIVGQYKSVQIAKGNQSQTFISFYAPIPPKIFQENSTRWEVSNISYLDQMDNYNLANYHFSKLNWPEDIRKNTLYISPPNPTLPAERRTLHVVQSSEHKLLEIFDFNQ